MQTATSSSSKPQLLGKLVTLVKWAKRSSSPKPGPERKTVGVHIPDAGRERLKRIQQAYNLSTYRDAVYLAILVGLTALEHDSSELQEHTKYD